MGLGKLKAGFIAGRFLNAVCSKCQLEIVKEIQLKGSKKATENAFNCLCEKCKGKIKKLTEKYKDVLTMVKDEEGLK